jgi:hypothetical protein
MQKRPFLDKSNKPTGQAIQAALGLVYTCYNEVMGLTASFSQDWIFSKSSGWMLKIFDRKKALLYLIPLNDGFKISLTIREDERDAFLQDGELETMHNKISSSKKYAEGFALQFDIIHPNEFQLPGLFIKKLIAIRV